MPAEGPAVEGVQGVGSTVAGAVLGTSTQCVVGSHRVRTAPGMAAQWSELADGTSVTATVGNGGLTLSDPSPVEQWLAFNASVRRAGERKCRLSFPSRGGLERGGDVLLSRGQARYPRARRRRSASPRVGSLPTSETETRGAVEGFCGEPSTEAEITPRVRGGCGWAVMRTWAACWASLSPFLSSRLEGGCRPSWAWLPSMCLCF